MYPCCLLPVANTHVYRSFVLYPRFRHARRDISFYALSKQAHLRIAMLLQKSTWAFAWCCRCVRSSAAQQSTTANRKIQLVYHEQLIKITAQDEHRWTIAYFPQGCSSSFVPVHTRVVSDLTATTSFQTPLTASSTCSCWHHMRERGH